MMPSSQLPLQLLISIWLVQVHSHVMVMAWHDDVITSMMAWHDDIITWAALRKASICSDWRPRSSENGRKPLTYRGAWGLPIIIMTV